METTVTYSTTEKTKKIIDLPKDIIRVLAIQAAKTGKSTKAFMESLLIKAANDMEDTAVYEYLSKTEPEGHEILNKEEKEEFEKKYNL